MFFEDVGAAVSYYRHVLAFDVEPQGDGSRAVARRHDATIQLRQAAPGEMASRGTGEVDAVVLVDRPYRLYRHIDDHGRLPEGSLGVDSDGFYRIGDHAGNLLALGPAGGVVPAAKRLVWPAATDRWQTRWLNWRNRREEAPYLRKFHEFYRQLPDQTNVFYMFFRGAGLLHWVEKSASYVPDDINLVLIGSSIPEYEQEWVRKKLGRPFFHLDICVGDRTALEFLMSANEYNFGWLHIDCLVLNDELFGEMSNIAADDCVNGVWLFDPGLGFPLAAAYFIFVNMAVVRELRDAGLAVSPNCYSHQPANRHVPGRRCYSDPYTRRLRRRLLAALSSDASAQVCLPDAGGMRMCDTMYMHQLMAYTLGSGVHMIRQLACRGCGGGDRAYEQASDEILHVSGTSYAGALSEFGQVHFDPATQLRYLLADHVALLDAGERLPQSYVDRQEQVTKELARFGLTPDAAVRAARQFLTEERGLSAEAAEGLLRPSSQRPRRHHSR